MSAHSLVLRTALVLSAAAVTVMLPPAQAQSAARAGSAAERVVRIIAHGNDGDASYYSVRCAGGARGDVRVEHERQRTCAVPQRAQARCRSKWTIQAASAHVCAASRR